MLNKLIVYKYNHNWALLQMKNPKSLAQSIKMPRIFIISFNWVYISLSLMVTDLCDRSYFNHLQLLKQNIKIDTALFMGNPL